MEPKQRQFTLWYYLGAMVLLFGVQIFLANPPAVTIPYSDFKALVRAGKIQDLTVGSDMVSGPADLAGAEKVLSPSTLAALKEHVPEVQHEPVAPATSSPSAAPSGTGSAAGKAPTVPPPQALKPIRHLIVSRRVEDPQLTAELDAARVRYTAANENRWLSTLL